MTTYFDAAGMALLSAETEERIGENLEGSTVADATPKPAEQKSGNTTGMRVLLIVGTAIVLIIAIVLALRSANKKYGKEW